MLRTLICLLLFLFIVTSAFPQATELSHQFRTVETVHLNNPMNAIDVRAIGMGNAQIANGKSYNAMMYNPVLLGNKRFSIKFLGKLTDMPTATYSAADYLSCHIDEFLTASEHEIT